MLKIIFVITALLLTTDARAALVIHCKANTADIRLIAGIDKTLGQVQVYKNGMHVYTHEGVATYNKTWESVTLDVTKATDDGLDGVKIYFESSRTPVGLRPYGETSKKLTPGEEGITLYGMNCDHSYDAIKKEVAGNTDPTVGDETEYVTNLVKLDGTTLNIKSKYRLISYDESAKLFKLEMETDQSRSSVDLPKDIVKHIMYQADQTTTYDDGTKITKTLTHR